MIQPQLAMAAEQQIIQYEYDGAGNIVGIVTGVNSGSPDVTSLTPSHINLEKTISINAVGVNLYEADVTTDHSGLTILENLTVSPELIVLKVSSSSDAEIGLANFTFTTRLGSDTGSIFVAERLPIISTDPNPIILKPDNLTRIVTLTFDLPFPSDQEFVLNVRDSSLAEASQQSFTLPAGETEVTFEMRGLEEGSTALDISQEIVFSGISIPVFITDPFELPVGNAEFVSQPLGVTVSRFDPPIEDSEFVSPSVGVLRNATVNDLPEGDRVSYTSPLGVLRNATVSDLPDGDRVTYTGSLGVLRSATVSDLPDGDRVTYTGSLGVLRSATVSDLPEGNRMTYTNPLGVLRNAVVDEFSLPEGNAAALSGSLGVAKSPYVSARSQSTLIQGTTPTLILTGVDLNQVTSIVFGSDNGITQTAGFIVNPAGTEIQIFLDISASASLGSRQIEILGGTETIPFNQAGEEIFQVITN